MKRNQKVQTQRVQKEKFERTVFPSVLPRNENQKKLLEAIKYNTVVVAHGSAGTGKAQPLDTPVLTPQGWVNIGSLKTGDVVRGSAGWVKVIGVFPQGLKDTVKFIFKDGATVESCTEHLWTVYDNTGGSRRSTSKSITLQSSEIIQRLHSPEGNISIQPCRPIEYPDSNQLIIGPYAMGALLGDGSLVNVVTFTSVDQEILDNLIKDLPEGIGTGNSKGIHFTITDNQSNWKSQNRIKTEIISLGLHGTRSHTKFVPDKYKYSSIEQRYALLQGLLDTDGTIDKRTGAVSLCTTSEVMAKDVREIVLSLGGKATIKSHDTTFTYKGEKKKGLTAYVVSINVEDKSRLFRLQRKKQYTSKTDTTQLRRVIAGYELTGKKECVCISVDSPDHLYVTNDYVLTHNTLISCYHAAKKLHYNDIKKIVLIRAYQPLAGRSIGLLPGDINDKLVPYYQQMLDYLEDCLGKGSMEIALKNKVVEICSLETIRGRSWDNCIVIVDEAQNLFVPEVQALMTRIGENCQMIICGDSSGIQTDVKKGMDGLTYLNKIVSKYNISDCAFVEFNRDDIVRSGMTKEFVIAFEEEFILESEGKGITNEKKGAK